MIGLELAEGQSHSNNQQQIVIFDIVVGYGVSFSSTKFTYFHSGCMYFYLSYFIIILDVLDILVPEIPIHQIHFCSL